MLYTARLYMFLQGIMSSLKEEDEMVQEAALNELTELMSMSSEESLTVLPLEQLVPQLVSVSQAFLLNLHSHVIAVDAVSQYCNASEGTMLRTCYAFRQQF